MPSTPVTARTGEAAPARKILLTGWFSFRDGEVTAGYYFQDLPTLGLWGTKYIPISNHIEKFFTDARSDLERARDALAR